MQEVIEDYYKEDGITITPAVQLEFEDSNYADDKEYNITYNGITWPSADSGNEQNNDAKWGYSECWRWRCPNIG